MSTLYIVQLSDAHVVSHTNGLAMRWPQLCRAVVAELPLDASHCVVAFCGDATMSGQASEYSVVTGLLNSLISEVRIARPAIDIRILTVPGNHDCDFQQSDQTARNTLRAQLSGSTPAESVAGIMLQVQTAYFAFSSAISPSAASLTPSNPYFCSHTLSVGPHTVAFYLVNSAWTSVRHEHPDLRYPLAAFLPTQGEVDIAVTVLHHPLHWFMMPGVRRELRDLIDSSSDLVLTGHEHEQASGRRAPHAGGELSYQEGGVLQDANQPDLSTFNIIAIDLPSHTHSVTKYHWNGDHYVRDLPSTALAIPLHNRGRTDRRMQVAGAFGTWLDELEDPLNHPRQPHLKLSDLFEYPDLRKTTRERKGKSGTLESTVERIKSERCADELCTADRALITGADRCGKTSICKTLFADLHSRSKVPVLIRGDRLPKSGSESAFRSLLAEALGTQYASLDIDAFEQLDKSQRTLIIDDFQNGPTNNAARSRLLRAIDDRFGSVYLVASDDLLLELLHDQTEQSVDLVSYQRYEICDFGFSRLESLTNRWMSLGRVDPDLDDIGHKALELAQQVQSVLSLAGLPHTPWLLVVILEQTDQADAPFVAARNGSYGHLYHAVITVALSRTHLPQFDLSGKFLYLAEFAYRLYSGRRATMSEAEYALFHDSHCKRFGLPFDCLSVRDDFVSLRMLRVDGDIVAFRSKWVYCFFVAWWLSRNVHRDEASSMIEQLSSKIYHETSANILVFLAHLSDNPAILQSMRSAARALFADVRPTDLVADVQDLNRLAVKQSLFSLPPTKPGVNRRIIQDAQDEQLAKRAKRSVDGRDIDHAPCATNNDDDVEEVHRGLNKVRAALKTIDILGQVLRNGATSIEEQEKAAIMRDVLGVGYRLLGYAYGHDMQVDKVLSGIRSRAFRLMVAEVRSQSGGNETLSWHELREIGREAGKVAKSFWFDINWMAGASVLKRLSSAFSIPVLEGTLSRLRKDDASLPTAIVELGIRLNKRQKSIPSEALIDLHKKLDGEGNSLPKVVLEALSWERLLLYETDYSQAQAICKEMGIDHVPVKSLDSSRKKFRIVRSKLRSKPKE
jgi:hypothetical protein